MTGRDTTAAHPGWGRIIGIAACILLARIAYLIWVCPYDLAADEAQYWDWSRRLDWSYYSKGPALAWVIAPFTGIFGITEWAVRLPAALAGFAGMLILARFTVSASGGNPRAGWYALLLYTFLPIYYATSQFMTSDSLFFVFWLTAAFCGWIMVRDQRRHPGWFLLLGSVIGVGMLCKYTILLIVPGLLYHLRRHGPLKDGSRGLPLLAFFAGLLIFSFPIAYWNQQHGWPTIAHLIGATRLPGGDVTPDANWHYNPLWTAGYPFFMFALLGPPAAILLLRTLRHRIGTPMAAGASITRYALHLSLPILAFYLLITLRTDIKLNWPASGFTVLLVPLAVDLAERIPVDRTTRILWRWVVGVGVVSALLISLAPYPIALLGKVNVAGKPLVDPARLLHRVIGFPRFADSVDAAAEELRRETGQEPFFIASTYGRAALLAFYLKDHPAVCSADSLMGGRESSYDYFPDTNLANPALLGRPAVLFDNLKWVWERGLYFQSIERSCHYGRVYRGYEYRGPSREAHMK